MLEFQSFIDSWDKRIAEQRQFSEQELFAMIDRHERENIQLDEALSKQIPLKPKSTSEILNLIKIKEGLIKTREYAEAQNVQKEINKVSKIELENWENERKRKINNRKIQLEKKQKIEIEALRIRLKAAEDELTKNKAVELQRLLQKYQNIKKDLESYQNHEINHLVIHK